jgi:hypothetical protein
LGQEDHCDEAARLFEKYDIPTPKFILWPKLKQQFREAHVGGR